MKLKCYVMGVVLCCLLGPVNARAQVSPAQIESAIEKAKAYLYKQQNAQGTWEESPGPVDKDPQAPSGGQWGGRTAMAVYTLLTIGEKHTDPKLKNAIDLLLTKPMTGVYTLGFKCQVWLHMPQTPEVKRALQRDARLLMTSAKTTATGLLVWDYAPVTPPRKAYSLSRAQYAALGLWAANEADIELPIDIWRSIEKTWTQAQTAEGGWNYVVKSGNVEQELTTMSLTAAGVATMYIAQDFTRAEMYSSPRGNAISPPLEKALKWMSDKFAERVAVNADIPREFKLAQLYAIERVGLASGLRRFGTSDWYAIGSAWLLANQSASGTFVEKGVGPKFSGLPNTCWGTLFLHRGRTPVAFNKLDYTAGVNDPKTALWNQRPRDIANLTRYISRSTEREIRWQIVGVDDSLAAMLEAPVLYISGDKTFDLKPEAKEKLKAYVEHGGLIVVNPDGGNRAFTQAVEKLGTEICAPSEFRNLPAEHPIFTNQNSKPANFKTLPALRSISNGVRELIVILPPTDPAKAWQLRSPKRFEDQWMLGSNLLSYAVDKSTFYARGFTWLAPSTTMTAKKKVSVARLQYPGRWNPEPQAMAQLTKFAQLKGIQITASTVKTGDDFGNVDLLYVAGAGKFQLDDATRAKIKAFTDAGKCVMFEAVGGDGEFAASAEAELSKLFGNDAIKLLPPTHAIYGANFKSAFRPFNILTITNPLSPQLRGVESNGKLVALLSREDISAGVLGVPTDGITGYTPASARDLMVGVLNYLKK